MTVINSSKFISVRIEGIEQVQDMLASVRKGLQTNFTRGGLRAAAVVIANEAKLRVPVKSGQLRHSIRVSSGARNGQPAAFVKAGDRFRVFRNGRPVKLAPYRTPRKGGGVDYRASHYAFWVEFGTKPHAISAKRGKALKLPSGHYRRSVKHPGAKPKPFLAPAFNAKQSEALAVMKAYIAKRIQAEVEKNRGGAK